MPDAEMIQVDAVKLVQGMIAMRVELNIAKMPTRSDIAAVIAWVQRAAEDDFESSLLANVIDGEMWVDWQQGAIVFRLSPVGIAKVERMAEERAGGDMGLLMSQMGIDPTRISPRKSDD